MGMPVEATTTSYLEVLGRRVGGGAHTLGRVAGV